MAVSGAAGVDRAGSGFGSDLLKPPVEPSKGHRKRHRRISSIELTQREFYTTTNQRPATTRAVLRIVRDA